MQKIFFLFGILFLLWACFNSKDNNKFSVSEVTPQIVDPEGGSIITIKGKKLSSVTSISIGGVSVEKFEIISDESIKVWPSALPSGAKYPIRIMYANDEIILDNAIESWSPSLIEGAIIFDAKYGINAETSESTYEWQKITDNIAKNWVPRDGNTLNYLPNTGKFWMVGGWNGYKPPDGFDYIDPALGLPPHSTTNEVWSSTNGFDWVKELSDDHNGFERRHSHATLFWKEKCNYSANFKGLF